MLGGGRQLDHLGMHIDRVAMKVYVSERKVTPVREMARLILSSAHRNRQIVSADSICTSVEYASLCHSLSPSLDSSPGSCTSTYRMQKVRGEHNVRSAGRATSKARSRSERRTSAGRQMNSLASTPTTLLQSPPTGAPSEYAVKHFATFLGCVLSALEMVGT